MNEEWEALRRTAQTALEPMKQWHHRCHEASIALVLSGKIKGLRVARGVCRVVGGQHSWCVIGDPYDEKAVILDPTLWSYTNIAPEVFVGDRKRWGHKPFGTGNIFTWGRPPEVPERKAYRIKPPKGGWSPAARVFFQVLGHIDLEGWRVLAHAPVQGWPAEEVLRAMSRHSEELRMAIPVDIRGMLLDEVPDLYPKS